MRKNKVKKTHSALYTLIFILIFIMLLSTVLSLLGIGAEQAEIIGGNLETTLITIKNAFSIEGIKHFFSNILVNLGSFESLLLLLIALIGVGLGEATGLFKAVFAPLSKLRPKYVTFIVFLISIISSFFLEYSFVFVIPIAGIIYKYLNRSSILGLMIAFIGTTIGYGTGIIANFDAYSLGTLTQTAAQLDVDKNFFFNQSSIIYIMLVSTILLSVLGTTIVEKTLVHKIDRETKLEDELVVSKKGLKSSFVVFILLLLVVLYTITTFIPGGGILLDKNQDTYIAQLFSESSPFRTSFVFIITFILSICSVIYGTISGNLKGSHEYTEKIGIHFDKLGYAFVLLFLLSQIMGVIEWTNIGNVVLISLVNLISSVSLNGTFLIIVLFLLTIIGTILIPSTLTKWSIMSPIIVPLFMRANLTPAYAQFIFMASDGIGKALTPIFPYFIILLGFMHKYGQENISLTKTFKTMLPTILMLTLVWIMIIICWYIIGLPIGVGIYPTI